MREFWLQKAIAQPATRSGRELEWQVGR